MNEPPNIQYATLKEEYIGTATEHKQLFGEKLIVQQFKKRSLGDMEVDILYLKKSIDTQLVTISNPYLAKYFKRVV